MRYMEICHIFNNFLSFHCVPCFINIYIYIFINRHQTAPHKLCSSKIPFSSFFSYKVVPIRLRAVATGVSVWCSHHCSVMMPCKNHAHYVGNKYRCNIWLPEVIYNRYLSTEQHKYMLIWITAIMQFIAVKSQMNAHPEPIDNSS